MVSFSKKTWIQILVFCCVITVLADIFLLHRHSHFAKSGLFSMDGFNGFYAILSLVGSWLLFRVSKIIYSIFSVEEDYYNDDF